jgi:hypothetical protein
MLYAGLAAGADGYLVEVHPNPRMSLSDSEQAFPLSGFSLLNNRAEKVWSRGQAYRKLPADSYTGGDVEVTRRGNIRQLSCGESEITWGKK